MKAYLTEWLIRFGTSEVDGATRLANVNVAYTLLAEAKDAGFMESNLTMIGENLYRITPAGLEYIKDERISD